MKHRRLIVALVGITMIRLAVSGQYKRYVRVGMGRWLALAGLVLGVLAIADFLMRRADESHPPQDPSGTHDSEDPREHRRDWIHDRQAAVLGQQDPDHPDASDDTDYPNHPDPSDHTDDPDHPDHTDHPDHDGRRDHGNNHGHDHSATPKIAWLLLAPIAVAFAVVPPALGKWGIDRASNAAIVATQKSNFLALKPSATPLSMATNEFVARAYDGGGSSLRRVTVSIDGFIIERTNDYVVIGRYSIACCAADAVAAQVRVEMLSGLVNIPESSGGPQGQWVTAVGTFVGPVVNALPILRATSLRAIPPPANTYEG